MSIGNCPGGEKIKNFIVYNSAGKILRTGSCADADFFLQAEDDEFVMEGTANDITQKVAGKKIVNKTPEEIETDNPSPPEIPEGERLAHITNEQWQAVLHRLEILESEA